ncbi:MAG TPA: cystathionine beta-lyase [Devosiaceae bacterium]|jgi:cystathionine beta-lyase|nr:cystathionine beta-lyase [Devosiaceae bacterium]
MTEDHGQNTRRRAAETVLTHGGRRPGQHFGFVNTPVFRGSTVLFGTLDELESTEPRFDYGRTGNPSSSAVEAVITELEGAAGTVLAPSGLSAISLALLAVLGHGDHLLVTDSAYGPTRRFSNGVLARMGVKAEYYDPRIGGGIETLVTERTKAIFVESPGSLTFEIQDLRAIVEVARRSGAFVIVDNSWATPLYHKPLELGADIVVHAGTKMFLGHSDAMFGTVSAGERAWPAVHQAHVMMGLCAAPDDCFLAARGLRTLAIRMREQSARALDLAQWLEGQPGVAAVLHPALASHPDHHLFRRDFTGSGSVFSLLLQPGPRSAVAKMVDDLELFGMGWSWGGYESLLLPVTPGKVRTATSWEPEGNMFRIHVGLEDIGELRTDLAAALERYRAALG